MVLWKLGRVLLFSCFEINYKVKAKDSASVVSPCLQVLSVLKYKTHIIIFMSLNKFLYCYKRMNSVVL